MAEDSKETESPELPIEARVALSARIVECDAQIESSLVDALVAHRDLQYEDARRHARRAVTLADFACEVRRWARWPWEKGQ